MVKRSDKEFAVDITAQLTVVGLMMLFLTLITMAALMPMIIEYSINMSNNLTVAGLVIEGVLARLISLFFIVAFLATIALYAAPMTR